MAQAKSGRFGFGLAGVSANSCRAKVWQEPSVSGTENMEFVAKLKSYKFLLLSRGGGLLKYQSTS
eukprot:2660713-Amphidinium_carterae.1